MSSNINALLERAKCISCEIPLGMQLPVLISLADQLNSSPLPNPLLAPVRLVRVAGNVELFTPTTDTDIARGVALFNASQAAHDGDSIYPPDNVYAGVVYDPAKVNGPINII